MCTPLKQSILTRISSSRQITNSTPTALQQQPIICIKEYESAIHPGHIDYQKWIQLNQYYFPHVSTNTLNDFFKIIRIINFGQPYIPTGLIHDLMQLLTSKQSNHTLQACFNSFFKINGLNDTVYGFRELKKYPSLRQIQSIYKNVNHFQRQKSVKTIKQPLCRNTQDVFNRVYQDSISRKFTSIKITSQAFINQSISCKFHPSITNYQPIQSRNKMIRSCQHPQPPKKQQNILTKQQSFIKPIYNTIVSQSLPLEGIPGVEEHILRKKNHQNKMKEIQRKSIKPVIIKKHIL